MKELQAIVRTLVATDTGGAVLATLVSVEGSSYRRPGARLLILRNGQRLGSISGGCLEEDVIARAARVAQTGEPDTVTYDTTSENDLVWGVGLGCHGIVRVFIEPVSSPTPWAEELAANFAARRTSKLAVVHRNVGHGELGTAIAPVDAETTPEVFVETVPPPLALYVFGAGDDAKPLVRLAKELGWIVTVADPRPAFATAARFPAADSVLTGAPGALVSQAALDHDSVAVVMTHHYVHDVPLISALLRAPVAYLGLLGPRKRAEKILGDIAGEGLVITSEQRARLHAPVGLDLGADGPEQVALAVVAEIQASLNGRNARPLRERAQPIHAASSPPQSRLAAT